MTKGSTPPPTTTTTTTTHEPPSQPTSPIAKRTKPNNDNDNMSGPAVTSISQPQPSLFVKKLTETASAPTRGSAFAAGYDIYSSKETVIPARGKALVDTGIAIAVPVGTCMSPLFPFPFTSLDVIQMNGRWLIVFFVKMAAWPPGVDSRRSISSIPAPE